MRSNAILLVEDNAADEELTRRALRKANLHGDIVVVRDGVEALDYLFCKGAYSDRDPSVQPTVVLLDIKLPRVDGLEVLRRLRADESTKLLRVVILTSSDEERDVVESYRLGANSYVRKPVDFGEFDAAVRQVGSYWTLLNVPVTSRTAAQ